MAALPKIECTQCGRKYPDDVKRFPACPKCRTEHPKITARKEREREIERQRNAPPPLQNYCALCARVVGVKDSAPWAMTFFLFFLGLVIPFWIITLPLFWGIGIINHRKNEKKVCGICSGPLSVEPKHKSIKYDQEKYSL